MLKANGFDKAVVGYDQKSNRIIYDIDKMVNILVKRDNITEEEAIEYLEYNTFDAWVGEQTPIYMYRRSMKQIEEYCDGEGI